MNPALPATVAMPDLVAPHDRALLLSRSADFHPSRVLLDAQDPLFRDRLRASLAPLQADQAVALGLSNFTGEPLVSPSLFLARGQVAQAMPARIDPGQAARIVAHNVPGLGGSRGTLAYRIGDSDLAFAITWRIAIEPDVEDDAYDIVAVPVAALDSLAAVHRRRLLHVVTTAGPLRGVVAAGRSVVQNSAIYAEGRLSDGSQAVFEVNLQRGA